MDGVVIEPSGVARDDNVMSLLRHVVFLALVLDGGFLQGRNKVSTVRVLVFRDLMKTYDY